MQYVTQKLVLRVLGKDDVDDVAQEIQLWVSKVMRTLEAADRDTEITVVIGLAE